MNKNFKVITINGIRGIFAVAFIVLGLIAGFIISPGWLCMTLWNKFVVSSAAVTEMNLIQGIMLWAVIALSLYALNNKRALIGFGSYQGLTPDQIKDIMNRTKMSEDKIKNEIELLSKELKHNADMKNIQEIKQSEITADNKEKEESGSKL